MIKYTSSGFTAIPETITLAVLIGETNAAAKFFFALAKALLTSVELGKLPQ